MLLEPVNTECCIGLAYEQFMAEMFVRCEDLLKQGKLFSPRALPLGYMIYLGGVDFHISLTIPKCIMCITNCQYLMLCSNVYQNVSYFLISY